MKRESFNSGWLFCHGSGTALERTINGAQTPIPVTLPHDAMICQERDPKTSTGKPNLDYYREILRRLNLTAEDCMMVGNDVREDLVAAQLGMKTFLLTDCVINPEDVPVEQWPHGGFAALQNYLKENLDL